MSSIWCILADSLIYNEHYQLAGMTGELHTVHGHTEIKHLDIIKQSFTYVLMSCAASAMAG